MSRTTMLRAERKGSAVVLVVLAVVVLAAMGAGEIPIMMRRCGTSAQMTRAFSSF